MAENLLKIWQKQWKESMEAFNKKLKDDFKKMEEMVSQKGSESSWEEQWARMTENLSKTFENWKRDWEEKQRENAERMAQTNAELRRKWEENSKKFTEFIENQRSQFQKKLEEVKRSIETSIREQEEFNNELQKAFKESWRDFIEGQRKVQESYMKMQNRLWWKGYLNFLATMLVIVGVIVAIVAILRHFGILG